MSRGDSAGVPERSTAPGGRSTNQRPRTCQQHKTLARQVAALTAGGVGAASGRCFVVAETIAL